MYKKLDEVTFIQINGIELEEGFVKTWSKDRNPIVDDKEKVEE